MFIYDRLLACTGTAGDFTLLASKDDRLVRHKAAAVIVAQEGFRQPDFALYGLSASLQVISLSTFNDRIGPGAEPFAGVQRIAFLTSLLREKTPVICENVMRAALKAQSQYGAQTFVFTRNLKVAAWGLEALYRETKMAGTIYVKMTDSIPEIEQDSSGAVTITYRDEITREFFRLRPDLTVVDETLRPSPSLKEMARVFALDQDADGFLQSDNVHRARVYSNRKGILVAGTARSLLAEGDQVQLNDAVNAAAAALKAVKPMSQEEMALKAEISTDKCVRCLTCYRLCPYRAVVLHDEQPVVAAEVCERCGICAAECPALAIRLPGLEITSIGEAVCARHAESQEKGFIPYLVAFCCGRSAVPAGELAALAGHKMPAGLKIIEVPCAGSISREFILKAFAGGADAVMVLACHEGNCHSERGNRHCRSRVAEIGRILPIIGIEKERLISTTFASNMGIEFARFMAQVAERMEQLGPRRPGGSYH